MTEKRFTFDEDANDDRMYEMGVFSDNGEVMETTDVLNCLNELHEEVMNLRAENTKFKLVVREIIEDMQKYVDDNQLVYINQSYVDWIKKEVDTTFYSQKKELEE